MTSSFYKEWNLLFLNTPTNPVVEFNLGTFNVIWYSDILPFVNETFKDEINDYIVEASIKCKEDSVYLSIKWLLKKGSVEWKTSGTKVQHSQEWCYTPKNGLQQTQHTEHYQNDVNPW